MNSEDCCCYVFTKDDVFLTEQQRDFYEDNGYIIFKNLVNHKLLDECKERFVDICEGKVKNDRIVLVEDCRLHQNKKMKAENLINKIEDFAYDDVLFKYISYPPLVNIMQSVIGPNISVVNTQLINRPPGGEALRPVHQDLHYFPFRPANNIVVSWTAMECVDQTNGCLFVIPGSHKGHLLEHGYPSNWRNPNPDSHGICGFENVPKINLELEKGDTVLFHPLLLHGSHLNLTPGFRKALYCHYADSNCHFIDTKGTNQECTMKEIEESYKKKVLKFNDIWRYKSRFVRGAPCNFQRFESQL